MVSTLSAHVLVLDLVCYGLSVLLVCKLTHVWYCRHWLEIYVELYLFTSHPKIFAKKQKMKYISIYYFDWRFVCHILLVCEFVIITHVWYYKRRHVNLWIIIGQSEIFIISLRRELCIQKLSHIYWQYVIKSSTNDDNLENDD